MQPPNNLFIEELMRQLRYVTGILVAPGIPPKKVTNAITKNSYQGTDPVIGLIDCTVFGSAKDNVMFTTTGIYWNHPSSKPNSGSLAYANFGSCFFKSAGFFSGINTGMGQMISLNPATVTKNDLITLLNIIKNLAVSNGVIAQQRPNSMPPQNDQPKPHQSKSKAELLALAHNMS